MRIAVISDVHANWEALTVVLQKLEELEPDRIVCLGDMIGYNPDPEPCLEEITSRTDTIVRGNHEKAVAGQTDIYRFTDAAREVALWTRKQLKPENLELVKHLRAGPLPVNDDFLISHGSPMDEDLYILYMSAVEESFRFMREYYPTIGICFFGHTHVPVIIEEDGDYFAPPEVFEFDPDRRYLVNPGSIGQPRDGNPLAAFGLFDDEKRTFEFFRLRYPFEETQQKILEAGLPPFLAERLPMGR